MANTAVHKKIKIGKKTIQAYLLKLLTKNLIVLIGKNGYIMCGYLNLKTADKFKEAAVKVVGVSSVEDALKAKVHSCSFAAKKIGIYKDQPIKGVLKIIA